MVDRNGDLLPLNARVETGLDRCVIRVQVRREEITVHRETFVSEIATVRRVPIEGEERVGETLRAERLAVDVEGDVRVAREDDMASAPEDREQAR